MVCAASRASASGVVVRTERRITSATDTAASRVVASQGDRLDTRPGIASRTSRSVTIPTSAAPSITGRRRMPRERIRCAASGRDRVGAAVITGAVIRSRTRMEHLHAVRVP